MIKILITGGTGLIGKQLTTLLVNKGYEVVILSRNPTTKNQFHWNISKNYIDNKAFENITHIIHLAGAGIADKRWTTNRKQELINSRVKAIHLLFKKVNELKVPLQKFITASGVGYYGARTIDKIFTETDTAHNDYISKICVEWEKSAEKFNQLKIPITIFRTGVVLSKKGGALQKIDTPIFLSVLGNGNQYLPWIHIDDLCNLYVKAIENNNFTGIYNAVAPEHQTNKSFTKTLGSTLKKCVLPVHIPSFLLKIILGELSCILLKGSRVSAEKISQHYQFKFINLKSALQNIYK